MHLNVMSFEGRPYLERTLASIPGEIGVTIFHQYEKTPLTHPKHRVVNSFVYKTPSRVAASWHYATIMREGGRMGEWLLLLEDDVVLCENFGSRLSEIIKGIPPRSVTALYSCYDWGRGDLEAVPYPPDQFYGTQAMIFGAKVIPLVSDYIFRYMLGHHNYDLIVKAACKTHGIPMFASKYSLAQHTGEITSLQSGFHKAYNFVDDLFVPLKKA